MEVLFAGDWHAGVDHALEVIDIAADAGIRRIVQVGDLGFWPRFEQGRQFLDAVSAHATKREVSIWFCDGNHEDHESLDHTTAEVPVEVWPNIAWVPRGVVLTWEGRRLLFMGGAVSIDQHRRRDGWTWFAEEIPSAQAWHRAEAAGPVDIVVAHDTVPGMPVSGVPQLSIPWSARTRASSHRKRLATIQKLTQPTLWVHGHWHQRASARLDGTRFESLGHDRGPLAESVIVCDLKTLTVGSIGA